MSQWGACGGNAQREHNSFKADILESPHLCPEASKGEDG